MRNIKWMSIKPIKKEDSEKKLTFSFINCIKLKKISSIDKSNDNGGFGDRRRTMMVRKIGIAASSRFTHKIEQKNIPCQCQTIPSRALLHIDVATKKQRHQVWYWLECVPRQSNNWYYHQTGKAWHNNFDKFWFPWWDNFGLSDARHNDRYLKPLQENSNHSFLCQKDHKLASWQAFNIWS